MGGEREGRQVYQSLNKVSLSTAFMSEKQSKGQQENLPFTTYNERLNHLGLVHTSDTRKRSLFCSLCPYVHAVLLLLCRYVRMFTLQTSLHNVLLTSLSLCRYVVASVN